MRSLLKHLWLSIPTVGIAAGFLLQAGADDQTWTALVSRLHTYDTEVQTYRDELTSLKGRKTELLNGTGRGLASEDKNHQMTVVNQTVTETENQLESVIQKQEFLKKSRDRLQDRDHFVQFRMQKKEELTSAEKEWDELSKKIDKLGHSCKDCKLVALTPDSLRTPASSPSKEHYQTLLDQRKALSSRMAELKVEVEALEDLADGLNPDSINDRHNMRGGHPVDYM